jgi:hypothetical protein
MRTVYVIGYPGVGKSSAVANALELLDLGNPSLVTHPLAHLRYSSHQGLSVWEMGKRREAFSGTDALGMSVQPLAVRWVGALTDPGAESPNVLIGEGDRLATRGFLDACPNLTVVHLSAPLPVAQQRASERAIRLGRSPQDPSWLRGRATKVDRLAFAYSCVQINAELSPLEVAEHLATVVCGSA